MGVIGIVDYGGSLEHDCHSYDIWSEDPDGSHQKTLYKHIPEYAVVAHEVDDLQCGAVEPSNSKLSESEHKSNKKEQNSCEPGVNQIVGHTPHRTSEHVGVFSGEQLWCCDTFSTGPDHIPHSDGAMLLLDTGKIQSSENSSTEDRVTIITQPSQEAFANSYLEAFGG